MNAVETDKYFADMRRGFDASQAELAALGVDPSDTRFKILDAREYLGGAPLTPAEKAAQGKPKHPSRVLSAQEFIGELKPREWLVKNLQPKDAQLCGIFGDPGDGKSFLLADIFGCVHRGAEWNGNKTVQANVVYLVAEGAGDFRYRHETYRKENGLAHSDLFRVIDNAPDLFDAKQAAAVAEQIAADGGCGALIIDTLSATFSGDEKGSDMNMYLRHVKLIQKALGCVVWVVSHSGKNRAAGMRGWSGQKAAFDVEIEVTTDEDKILRTATITKMKGGTAGAKFDFKLRSVPLGIDAEGDAYGSCVAEYVKHEYKPRAVKLSKVQSSALATIKRLSPDCDGVDWSDAVDAVSKARGFEKVKPYHRRDSMLTLHELKALGKVWIKGGEGAELLMGFGGSEPAEGWLNE